MGEDLRQSYYFGLEPPIMGEMKHKCEEVGIKIREEVRKMGFQENEIHVKSWVYSNRYDDEDEERCMVVLEDLSDKPVSR
jgi:hypothetical protein